MRRWPDSLPTPSFPGFDLQPGDTLTGTLTQAYASKNVMGTNGSTLVANGPYAVADGNGGNNYTVALAANEVKDQAGNAVAAKISKITITMVNSIIVKSA